MAMFHGSKGSLTWADVSDITNITSWSVDATADTAETTHMSDANYWKQRLAGFKDWSGSVEVFTTSDASLTGLGNTGHVTFELLDAGTNISGSCICTGIGFALDKDDVAKTTFTMVGNGALS